jgi:hypothetical protein
VVERGSGRPTRIRTCRSRVAGDVRIKAEVRILSLCIFLFIRGSKKKAFHSLSTVFIFSVMSVMVKFLSSPFVVSVESCDRLSAADHQNSPGL